MEDPKWEGFGLAQGEVPVPVGKRLGLWIAEARGEALSALGEIPPDAIQRLSIDLSHSHGQAEPGWHGQLGQLTGLRTLSLVETGVSPDAYERLRRCPGLERLHIAEAGLDDAALAAIAGIRTLKGLRIWTGQEISADGLAHLGGLPVLEELFLGGDAIANESLAVLRQCRRLRRLALYLRGLDETGLAQVAGIPQLEHLEVGRKTGAAMMQRVGEISGLKSLKIRELESPSSLREVAKLKHLQSLDVRCAVGDEEIAALKSLARLRSLHLSVNLQLGVCLPEGGGIGVTDVGLAHLAEIRTLESIELYGGIYTDAGLTHLSRLSKLKTLRIPNNSGFTDAGVKQLSKLTGLERLHLRGENITSEGLRHLAGLPKLRSLRLLSALRLTDEGLACLGGIGTLETIDVFAPNTTHTGVNRLNSLTGLRSLRIGGNEKRGITLDLGGLEQLRELELSGVGDDDVGCLIGLRHLGKVRISGRDVPLTDRGLERFAELPALSSLAMGPQAELNTRAEGVALFRRLRPRVAYSTWPPLR